MPIYAYQCASEDAHEFEQYVPLTESENPLCSCGATTEKIWKISKRTGYTRYPYVTKNITGEPVEVTDAAHEAALCKQYGVVQRDDAAWIEEEYLGYNPRTGKQEYGGCSGVGLPGCWV
jgi:hypothetical protein